MRFACLTVGLLAVLAPASAARACIIDSTPSISANDTLAVLNTAAPTQGKVTVWAPFRFRKAFAAGSAVRFSENARALARVLPPEVVHGRWIWRLGDGTHAVGYTPVHRYTRPGTYVVAVGVALPHSTETFTFDAAQVLITH